MPNARLYTAPGYDGPPLSIDHIAALAGCALSVAYVRVRDGLPLAGKVWARTAGAVRTTADRRRAPRTLLTAPGFDGTVGYAELMKMGGFQHEKTAVVYVSQGMPIGGRVWTRVNPRKQRDKTAPVVVDPVAEESPAPKPVPQWHKPTDLPAPTPSAEPRRFVMAHETVGELLQINPMRLQAAPDAPTGVTL